MKTLKILQVHRKSNKIVRYTVQDEDKTLEIVPRQLKLAIKSQQVNVQGYKLTSDNRLIKTTQDKVDIAPQTKSCTTPRKFIKEIRTPDGLHVFIKGSSDNAAYSEYYTSVLAEYLGYRHIDYSIRYNGKHTMLIVGCQSFTDDATDLISAHKLGIKNTKGLLEYCKSINDETLNNMLDMLFLDCLTLNTDRGFSNILFLRDKQTSQILGVAPIFNNDRALLPDFKEGIDFFDRTDYTVDNRISFEQLYSIIRKYKNYKQDIEKLKQFRFSKPSTVDISQSRLDFLNDFISIQVNELLSMS